MAVFCSVCFDTNGVSLPGYPLAINLSAFSQGFFPFLVCSQVLFQNFPVMHRHPQFFCMMISLSFLR